MPIIRLFVALAAAIVILLCIIALFVCGFSVELPFLMRLAALVAGGGFVMMSWILIKYACKQGFFKKATRL